MVFDGDLAEKDLGKLMRAECSRIGMNLCILGCIV
jgi:hypothetical protein